MVGGKYEWTDQEIRGARGEYATARGQLTFRRNAQRRATCCQEGRTWYHQFSLIPTHQHNRGRFYGKNQCGAEGQENFSVGVGGLFRVVWKTKCDKRHVKH
jgi:hypothetical protein